jgi:hypothetical protein
MGQSSSQHVTATSPRFYNLCKFSFLFLITIVAASNVSMKVSMKSRPMVFSVQRNQTGLVVPAELVNSVPTATSRNAAFRLHQASLRSLSVVCIPFASGFTSFLERCMHSVCIRLHFVPWALYAFRLMIMFRAKDATHIYIYIYIFFFFFDLRFSFVRKFDHCQSDSHSCVQNVAISPSWSLCFTVITILTEQEPSITTFWSLRDNWVQYEQPPLVSSQSEDANKVGLFIYMLFLVLAYLAEALCYKPEGRGISSQWCHWIFQLI